MNIDLDDAFEGYMRTAYPKVKITEVQFEESRRVFIAGMFQMFIWVKSLDVLTEDEGIKVLNKLNDNFEEYLLNILKQSQI